MSELPESDHLGQDKAHPARLYDHYLGGKDNYEVDRQAALQVAEVFPYAGWMARANRDFMNRAVDYLARSAGIRQFLDIGTGIPTEPNLHQVAQDIAPESRVAYVDNDPIVLAHARALMNGTPEGHTDYIHADFTDPDSILSELRLCEPLDLTQPVALSLIALLHFISDKHRPYEIVRRLLDELAPGSYLVMSHATADFDPDSIAGAVRVYRENGMDPQVRSRTEFEQFFEGMELVEPGVVVPHRWRATGIEANTSMDAKVSFYAGLARMTTAPAG